MSEGAVNMIVHVYGCPECEQEFTVHHPDEKVYPDACPNCCYSMPNLLDMVDMGDGDDD
jgi:DNA-directed RNA polymerase subunit RPC12/RpoP